MSTTPAPDPTYIDQASLGRYLSAHLTGFRGPLEAEKFAGGQSNPTFRIRTPGKTYVLRRKPPGQLLKSAHQVDREFRVMQALKDTDVPVPRMHLLCEDESVLGSMFFVMEFLEGRVFWDPALPELTNADRSALYNDMNRILSALSTVDPAKVGLAEFGRPGSYFARQTKRWTDQYRASETVTIPEMDILIDWLGRNMPADDGHISVVHGDYRLDNMIFHPTEPRCLAVVDWELSTLGHPFSDIAYQCMQWRLLNEGIFRGLGGRDRPALGIPTEEEYVAKYCQRIGIPSIPIWTFCLVFNFFRLAAIIQGVYKRGLDGNASNRESALQRGAAVPQMARMAVDLIEKVG
ncbi:MAG: phosphotransferase [Hyphomicrobiaceae bacterium]|jgi:aminoglycoside phosphotransferase (APT) family kinase protein